jgi:hypothetical protein
MRYYVLRAGEPPQIRAEFLIEHQEAYAVESGDGVDDRRKGMAGAVDLFVGEKILLRRELLAVPAHAEALRRWDSRDEETFHTAEHNHYMQEARRDAEALASRGCGIAADLLAHATDEELDNFIPNHVCRVDNCGGSLFSPRDLECV